MPSNYLIPCYPLLLLPSIFPSISPSNEYLGLISFRIDWFDLLAVQGNLQGSPPAPQFESINSLALSLLFGPTLTLVSSIYLPSHDLLLKLKIPFLSILSFLYEVNILLLRCYLSSSSNCLLESPSLTSPMCMWMHTWINFYLFPSCLSFCQPDL